MFKAMMCALLEPQQQPDQQEPRPQNDEEAPVQSKPRMDQQQVSLPEADPAGFYIGSAFFAKAPTRSSRVRCIRCGDVEATVDCFSCSRFYGAGGGKFCGRCFEVCHPFYRVKHKWALLEDMDQQTYGTNLERTIADIRGLLDVTSNWGRELYAQDNDTKGDDTIKEVARLDEDLSAKIRDLKDLICEDEDRTKVEASAIGIVERSAIYFQKRYEERQVADVEAGGEGGKNQ